MFFDVFLSRNFKKLKRNVIAPILKRWSIFILFGALRSKHYAVGITSLIVEWVSGRAGKLLVMIIPKVHLARSRRLLLPTKSGTQRYFLSNPRRLESTLTFFVSSEDRNFRQFPKMLIAVDRFIFPRLQSITKMKLQRR